MKRIDKLRQTTFGPSVNIDEKIDSANYTAETVDIFMEEPLIQEVLFDLGIFELLKLDVKDNTTTEIEGKE